jgi:N,N'-diacetyllegionaminate synthase
MIDPVQILVNGMPLGEDHPCFIAAEIGLNHNGDIDLAYKSIEAAAAAGANGVKLQNYETTDFLQDQQLSYTYENSGNIVHESQWEMFKRCELSEDELINIKHYCDKLGITFFSTPTSQRGVTLLQRLDVQLLKNGSDFLTNLELVKSMAETGKLTVLSTGMATIAEIDDAVRAFREAGGHSLILLHCTSSYPTPVDEINLKRIPVLAQAFGCLAGFSDHSEGIAAAVGARVLGACFIEKHFTLSNDLPGPDHRFSSNPAEFSDLVRTVRTIESAMGTAKLGPTLSEYQGRTKFRLSCQSTTNLNSGKVLESHHIVFMRPGTGIPPKHCSQLIGLTLKHPVQKGHLFNWNDFK